MKQRSVFCIYFKSRLIEEKNSEANGKKASAWKPVHKAFVATCGEVRSIKQLKKQCKQTKISAKYKKEQVITGSDTHPKLPKPVDIEVKRPS
jgi:hypothetical protein